MPKTFKAETVSIAVQDSTLIVGFADNAATPNEYLLLQRSLQANDRDRKLEQDTYYFELSGPLNSGYDGIERAILRPESLVLEFKNLNNHPTANLLVLFDLSSSDWEKLSQSLQFIFGASATI